MPSCCVSSHIILPKVFLLGGPSVKKQAPNRADQIKLEAKENILDATTLLDDCHYIF
jgi:hypothetical protein